MTRSKVSNRFLGESIMSILISVGTLICFTFFIAIVFRAYSRRQQPVYVEAAHIPFDLPDEFAEKNAEKKASDKSYLVSPAIVSKGEQA